MEPPVEETYPVPLVKFPAIPIFELELAVLSVLYFCYNSRL